MKLKRLVVAILMTASLFAFFPGVFVAFIQMDYDESDSRMSGRIEPQPPLPPPASAVARVPSPVVEPAFNLPLPAPKLAERVGPGVKPHGTPRAADKTKAQGHSTAGRATDFVELPTWNRRDVFVHPYGRAEKRLFEQVKLQLTGERQIAAPIGLFTPLSEAGRISGFDNIPLQVIIGWEKQLETPVRLNRTAFAFSADVRSGAEAANLLKIPMIEPNLNEKYLILPFSAVPHAVFDLADAQGVDLWAEAMELEAKGVPFVEYLLQHHRVYIHKPPSLQACYEFRAVEVGSAEEFVVEMLPGLTYKRNVFIQQFKSFWEKFDRYYDQIDGTCFSCRHFE